MNKHKTADGKFGQWLSYRTQVKDVYVRMETDKIIKFCFDIQPKDDGIRSILWEQMTELKRVMEESVGPASYWNEFDHQIGNQNVSRICWETQLNFFHDDDLPLIEEFLEEKLRSFDQFYSEYKDILINLAQ